MANFVRWRQLHHQRARVPVPARYGLSFECREFDEVVTARDHFGATDAPPLVCRFTKWFRGGTFMATADEQGLVHLFDIERPLQRGSEGAWEAHKNAVFDLAWMPVDGEAKLLTASGDQKIQLWDLKTRVPLVTFSGHTGSVKSVNFCPEEPMVFASGARDGHILLWDLRVNRSGDKPYQVKPCSQLLNAHNSSGVAATNHQAPHSQRRQRRLQSETAGRQSVTAVVFQNDRCIVSAGGGDGAIKIWDIRKPYSIHQLDSTPVTSFLYSGERQGMHGFTDLVIDPTRSSVYASCTDDVIYQYDITGRLSRPVSTLPGAGLSSYYVKMDLSKDGDFLVTGSTKNDAVLYQTRFPHLPPVALSGHVGEVMGVAFCPAMQCQLATCSEDGAVRVWRQKGMSPLYCRENGRCIGDSKLLPAPPKKIMKPPSPPKEPTNVQAPSQQDKCKRTASLLHFVTVTPSKTSAAAADAHDSDKENEIDQPRYSPAAKRARHPVTTAAVSSRSQVGRPGNDDTGHGRSEPLVPLALQTLVSRASHDSPPSSPATPAFTTAATLPAVNVTPTSSATPTSRISPNARSRRGTVGSRPTTPRQTALQQWLSPQPRVSPGGLAAAAAPGTFSSGTAQLATSPSTALEVSPSGCAQRRRTNSPEPSSTSADQSSSSRGSSTCRQNLLDGGRSPTSPNRSPVGGLVAAAE